MRPSLLQRTLCFSDLSICSIPTPSPIYLPTLQKLKKLSESGPILCPISFLSFHVQKQELPYLFLPPLSFLSCFLSHLFHHSHHKSIVPPHTYFSLCAVHSPHLVLSATLTHFGVLVDCLGYILYATLDVPHLGEWVGCGIHERRAQVSSLLLPEPHGEPR